jgi:hypothetical protein
MEMQFKRQFDIFVDMLLDIRKKRRVSTEMIFILTNCCRLKKQVEAFILLINNRYYQEANSIVRNICESLIIIIGAWKWESYDIFKSRLHANSILDNIGLMKIRFKHFAVDETEKNEIKNKIDDYNNELAIMKQNGIKAFANTGIHEISEGVPGLLNLKDHYYKYLSLQTHANLHSIEDFITRDSTDRSISIRYEPEEDKSYVLYEILHNFMIITNSALNNIFELNRNLPNVNDILKSIK